MRRATTMWWTGAAVFLVYGCGSDTETGPQTLAPTCAVDGDCANGLKCAPAGLCVARSDGGSIDGRTFTTFGDASSSSSSGASSSGASSSGADAGSTGASDTAKKGCISSGECDDGDPCTDDYCSKGACEALPKADCCKVDGDCDDKLGCTADTCTASGMCNHTPNGQSCFIDGKCVKKGESGTNPCEVCEPAKSGTAYTAIVGPSCDDGNPCSTGDVCVAGGMCVGQPKQGCCLSDVACVTGSACKTGTCNKTTNTCKIVTKPGCCTVDTECAGAGEACSKTFCDPATNTCNSSALPDGSSCDDGNGCTLKDACKGGTCQGGTTGCNDGNPCTKDACVAGKCQHTPTANCCAKGACCNIGPGTTKAKGDKCGSTVRKIEYSCLGQVARRRYAFDGCDGVATTCMANKTLHYAAWQTIKICASGSKCVSKGTSYSCQGGSGGGTADLQSSSLKTSKTLYKPGEKALILSAVRNGGKGHAGPFTVEYRLSTNTLLSTGDKLISTVKKTSLPSLKTISANAYVTIPATTKPGTYYLFVWIDRTNQVKETTTSNNRRYVKVTISGSTTKGIDLAPQSFKTTKTSYKAGETVVFTGLIRNLGTLSSGTFTAEYRLSTNTAITTADPLLRVVTKPSLGASVSTSATTIAKIPSNAKSGTYYVALWADRTNKVKETNESNNIAMYKVTIDGSSSTTPDLTPYSFKSTKTFYKSGETVVFTGGIRNLGKTTAPPYVVDYRLSTNSSVSTLDPVLRTVSKPALAAGGSTSALTTGKIPPTTKPGTYYLGIWVDRTNKVKEGNESNNIAVFKITVGSNTSLKSDLVGTSLKTSKTSYKAGETAVIYGSVRNQGLVAAGSFTVEYRLSKTSIITTLDPLLATVKKTGLSPNSQTSATAVAKIPANISAGTWYIGMWIDRTNKVSESSTINNKRVYKITIGSGSTILPDLVPISFKPTKTVYSPGSQIVFTGSIRNMGKTVAAPFSVEYRLSKTSLLLTFDPLLKTLSKGALAGGMTTSALTFGVIPKTTKPGTYYVGIWLDRLNKVKEGNESNNKAVHKITVSGAAIK